jgi:hypothetical protein
LLASASFARGLWLCPFIENVADRLSTLDSWSSDRYFTLISPGPIDSDRDSAVIPGNIQDIDTVLVSIGFPMAILSTTTSLLQSCFLKPRKILFYFLLLSNHRILDGLSVISRIDS